MRIDCAEIRVSFARVGPWQRKMLAYLEDEIDSRQVECRPDDRYDPVDRSARGPSEDEERDGNEERGDEGELEADFRCKVGVLGVSRLHVVAVVRNVGGEL